MSAGLSAGDIVTTLGDALPHYAEGDTAFVLYTIEDLEKIIVKVVGRKTACLYAFEEGGEWARQGRNVDALFAAQSDGSLKGQDPQGLDPKDDSGVGNADAPKS